MTITELAAVTLPTNVVLVVFASNTATELLPVTVTILKELFAFSDVLPVMVTFELAFREVEVTFVVDALIFKKLPLINVFPLTAEIETLFVVIITFEKLEFALNETTLAPEKTKAVFDSRLSVLPAANDPPVIPLKATTVFAPKKPLT